MKTTSGFRLARLWALFAAGHMLAVFTLGYATDRVGAQLKVSPSETGLSTVRVLDGVTTVFAWPASFFVNATAFTPAAVAAVMLHALGWGAVWLLLFRSLRGLARSGTA